MFILVTKNPGSCGFLLPLDVCGFLLLCSGDLSTGCKCCSSEPNICSCFQSLNLQTEHQNCHCFLAQTSTQTREPREHRQWRPYGFQACILSLTTLFPEEPPKMIHFPQGIILVGCGPDFLSLLATLFTTSCFLKILPKMINFCQGIILVGCKPVFFRLFAASTLNNFGQLVGKNKTQQDNFHHSTRNPCS